MATLHKFVSSGASLTVNNIAAYCFLNYTGSSPYWQSYSTTSAFHIQYVDITGHINDQIEIVLPSATDRFFNSYNFNTASSTNKLTVITAPTPTIIDGKYHYIFPAGTFTYTQVAPCGPYSSKSGNNHYYNGMDITSATAGGPHWEDVDIPEYSDPITYTIQTFNTGNTSNQYSNIYYKSYSYYIGQSNQSSSGKLKYFALPAGVKRFYTTSPRIAVTTTMAVGQWVQYFYPTETVNNKYYYDVSSFTQSANYVILLDSNGTKGYDGIGGVDGGWGIGSTHERVSGSWT